MAGCVMQICLTTLWSPNHSEVPGSLILCIVTKKLLCAHLCLRWTCEVCFQVAELLAAPLCFGSLLLGVPCFPVAVTLSPVAAVGMGAFGRSLTPTELNLVKEWIFFSYCAPLEGVTPLARRTLDTRTVEISALMVIAVGDSSPQTVVPLFHMLLWLTGDKMCLNTNLGGFK